MNDDTRGIHKEIESCQTFRSYVSIKWAITDGMNGGSQSRGRRA